MRITKSTVVLPIACAFAVLVSTAAPAAAQTSERPPATSAPASPGQVPPAAEAPTAKPDVIAPIRGELTEVNSEAKTLSVTTATGAKVEFIYNDATQVSGAKEGVAGLAAMKNVQIAVHFSEDAKTKAKTATRIEVQPKPVAAPQPPAAQPKPADAPPRY